MKHSQPILSLCGSFYELPMKSMSTHLVSGIDADVARESLFWDIFMCSRSARFLSSDATLGVSNQCPLSSSRSLVQLSFATGILVIPSGDTRDSNLVDSASSIR